MVEEHEPWILDLENIFDAINFAKEIWPESDEFANLLGTMQDTNTGNESWICVVGRCDICSQDMVFFAPSAIYDDGIIGVECCNCESMSVYPQERETNKVY
ncbi:MAG TPA: hypothetical protein ENH82_02080 [bacterium]|nr:hypothetical protein [bacterium]